jgi:hypothetical protein
MSYNLINGYHGTTIDAALSICQNGFNAYDKKHYWFGKGVYFFQDATALAWKWAKWKAARQDSEPAVVSATIDLKDCMDLVKDIGWGDIIMDAHRRFEEKCIRDGIPVPIQKGVEEGVEAIIGVDHELDCSVINHAVKLLYDEGNMTIRSVRGVFWEGRPLYKTSHLFTRGHVAIAVRDISVIGKPFLVKAPR